MVAGNLTQHGMLSSFRQVLDESGLQQTLNELQRPPPSPMTPRTRSSRRSGADDTVDGASGDQGIDGQFMWPDGCYRLMPVTYKLPRQDLLTLWQHWVCGSTSCRPLRRVHTRDIQQKERRLFRKASRLCKLVEEEVKRLGIWSEEPTLGQANEMFSTGKHVIPGVSETLRGRKRQRTSQLSWVTIFNSWEHSLTASIGEDESDVEGVAMEV